MYRKTVLDNGIKVVTESLPYFPTVSLGIWWKTGSRDEEEETSGISHFIEHMLFKGTERRTAQDIAREIDAVGGVLNAFTGKEYTCLYARVLRQDMDIAIDVLADMCRHSTFSADDIDREKHVVIQEIKMIEDNPEEYVFDLFTADYYKGHPLGLPVLGEEASVESFTRDDLMAHFAAHHCPRNTIITAVGRIDHDAFVKRMAELFSGYGEGGAAFIRKPETPQLPGHQSLRKRPRACLPVPGDRRREPDGREALRPLRAQRDRGGQHELPSFPGDQGEAGPRLQHILLRQLLLRHG